MPPHVAASTLTAALVVAAWLYWVPILFIGDTAVTDHVFLWGSDGLSIWSRDPIAESLQFVQYVSFGILISCPFLALIIRRWRLVLVSVGMLAAGSAGVVACVHAWTIAPSPSAVGAMPKGIALVLALAILLTVSLFHSVAWGTGTAMPTDAPSTGK